MAGQKGRKEVHTPLGKSVDSPQKKSHTYWRKKNNAQSENLMLLHFLIELRSFFPTYSMQSQGEFLVGGQKINDMKFSGFLGSGNQSDKSVSKFTKNSEKIFNKYLPTFQSSVRFAFDSLRSKKVR